MRGSFLLAATLGVSVAVLPRSALAFDITGHWTGSWKCAVFDAGAKTKAANTDSTIDITQAGSVFGAVIDGGLDYSGIAIAEAGKPDKGAVGIIHCGTSDDLTQDVFAEFGNWKVATKDTKGKLSGITVWSDDSQHVATCKYKYKRVDTVDPAVPTVCP